MLPTEPSAVSPPEVLTLAQAAGTTAQLDDLVARCRACPRLVAWREEVARVRRAAFADQEYWGRPVPSWGREDAQLAIVGLAPAAHGGTAPAASSPVTAAATGCSPRCTAPVSRPSPPRCPPTTTSS